MCSPGAKYPPRALAWKALSTLGWICQHERRGIGPMAAYAYFSVTKRCVNRGNLLIDEATRRVLRLRAVRTLDFDAHAPLSADEIAQINSCRALILPGATLLQPEDHAAIHFLGQVRCPILSIGVALRSILDVPDLTAARDIGLPVGSRDPFTHLSLRRAGIRSYLVGCQTLFFGQAQAWRRPQGPIVITPGLGDQASLERCILACADLGPVIVLLQAPGWQREVFDRANIEVAAMSDAPRTLTLLNAAAVVVTGRLHTLLACVAIGTPVIFMGGWYDSRYSLIEYLGIPIEPPVPVRIRNLAARVLAGVPPRGQCFDVADGLRSAMRRYLERFARPLGLDVSGPHL